MRNLDDLFPAKHSIADGLYIKTADENYVVARWCSIYGLETDFFWLAAHSLEKYMKAALLLNEQSAKEYTEGGKTKHYGHDIEKLYQNLRPLLSQSCAIRGSTHPANGQTSSLNPSAPRGPLQNDSRTG